MKLYERIENNNFDEIDRNRAIELIEGGNGHLVYNENYFKLQKENEDITQQRDYYKARYNELSKIVDLMAKHIYILGDYTCLYEECDDNMNRECEDCIKEYFYKKSKGDKR